MNFGKPDKRVGGGSVGRQGIGIPKENPKHIQAQKDGKIPFEYLVLSVLEDDAYVHQHGADKYGKNNWQIDEIRASTYIGAMFRHYKAWCDGEDIDPDSKRPHLTHLRACCAVVMDAAKHGKLIDDRLFSETKGTDPMRQNTCTCKGAPHDPDCGVFAATEDSEQWVVIETLELGNAEGNVRGYGTFSSKEAAQDYGRIVHRASARQNFCSVMRVNNMKNVRSAR